MNIFKALKHKVRIIRREIHVHKKALEFIFLLWIDFLANNIIIVIQIDKIVKVADKVSIIEMEDIDIKVKNGIKFIQDKHVNIIRREIIKGHLLIDVIGSKSIDDKGIKIVNIYWLIEILLDHSHKIVLLELEGLNQELLHKPRELELLGLRKLKGFERKLWL